MRDHHLVDYELQVLLAVAGKRPPMRWGAAYGQSLEVLKGFGFIERRNGAHRLTPEGVEVVESVSPEK